MKGLLGLKLFYFSTDDFFFPSMPTAAKNSFLNFRIRNLGHAHLLYLFFVFLNSYLLIFLLLIFTDLGPFKVLRKFLIKNVLLPPFSTNLKALE